MNALDRVHTARLVAHVERTVREGLKEFRGEADTPATRARMKMFINDCYAKMGLSQQFVAEVESAHDLVETPIIEALPPETDGTIQMGEGDGPEIVTGKTVTKVDRPGNELVVNVQVKQPAQLIHIDFNIL